MASITKKMKKGRPYYYAVESARVNGKPRIVWQKYLGTVDAIVQRAERARPAKPKETVIFEAGGVAALLRIAQRLGVLELIDDVVPKREQGPSVGHYMVLAAINRAMAPTSKLKIGDWYEDTVLRRLWRFKKAAFLSQRFWDHMDMISERAIDIIQDELALRVQREFGVDGQTLLYDTTNFFTFLSTTNDRCGLAQRGHSKAKRYDLRQVGLALLVTSDHQIPLFHRVYPGNTPDVSLFTELVREMIERHKRILKTGAETTLVFDKGNVSDDAMERIVVEKQHFVAAMAANRVPHILAAPLNQFEDVPGLPGTKALQNREIFFGKECFFVTVYTESFFTQQMYGITHNMVKCQKKLLDLEKILIKWRAGKARGKAPTAPGVKKSANSILAPQFMKDIFKVKVEAEKGLPVLSYEVNHNALERLSNERLGRTVLVTDRMDWNAKQTIETYRSLSQIEEAFKNMKNIEFLHWQPAYHWTDQKLRVHGFYCVLALLLSTLAKKIAAAAGIELSLPSLLKELAAIREVAVIYPKDAPTQPKDHITLTRMSPQQRKLANSLEIGLILGR